MESRTGDPKNISVKDLAESQMGAPPRIHLNVAGNRYYLYIGSVQSSKCKYGNSKYRIHPCVQRLPETLLGKEGACRHRLHVFRREKHHYRFCRSQRRRENNLHQDAPRSYPAHHRKSPGQRTKSRHSKLAKGCFVSERAALFLRSSHGWGNPSIFLWSR